MISMSSIRRTKMDQDEEEATVADEGEVVQEEAMVGTVSIAVICLVRGIWDGVNEAVVGTLSGHIDQPKKEVCSRLFTSKLCLRIVHRFLMLVRVCNSRTASVKPAHLPGTYPLVKLDQEIFDPLLPILH